MPHELKTAHWLKLMCQPEAPIKGESYLAAWLPSADPTRLSSEAAELAAQRNRTTLAHY